VRLLQHYFTGKDDLVGFTLELIGEQHGDRQCRRAARTARPLAVIRLVLEGRRPAPDAREYLRTGIAVLADHLAVQLRALSALVDGLVANIVSGLARRGQCARGAR
jgi:hypothetical protein